MLTWNTFVMFLLCSVAVSVAIQSDEERLLEYLFAEYNPSARPVMNSTKTVNVMIQFSLMHIQELVSGYFLIIFISSLLRKNVWMKVYIRFFHPPPPKKKRFY